MFQGTRHDISDYFHIAVTVHVEAAAKATLLALTKGKPGIYNVAEDDAGLSSEKAKRELGFDAGFRIKA